MGVDRAAHGDAFSMPPGEKQTTRTYLRVSNRKYGTLSRSGE
jgi:hypothetical protein